MASTSYSLSLGQGELYQPDQITVGASAPGAGDVELRINDANIHSALDVILIVKAFLTRLEDTRLVSEDLGVI